MTAVNEFPESMTPAMAQAYGDTIRRMRREFGPALQDAYNDHLADMVAATNSLMVAKPDPAVWTVNDHVQVLVTTALSQFDVQCYVAVRAEALRPAPVVSAPPRPAAPPAKTVDRRVDEEIPF